MDSQHFKRTQISEVERSRLLDKLERVEHRTGTNPKRASARMEYRVRDIPLSVNHPGGGVGRYIVLGRNLSSGGISLIHAGYIHNGTECRMALTLPSGGAKTLIGKVVFCRLACGQMHEVGVQFTEKIDVEQFAPADLRRLNDDPEDRASLMPIRGNAIIIAPAEADRRLIAARLKQTGLNPTPVEHAGAALDQVKLLSHVLAVIDMAIPDPKPAALVDSLRKAGFTGCVLGLAHDASPVERQAAIDMGMHGCISKSMPLNAMHRFIGKLVRSIGGEVNDGSPIYSTIAGEPGSEDLIGFFLGVVAEAAAAIAAALQRDDVKALQKECQSLRSIAGGYGFPSVVESARQAVAALDSCGSLSDISGRITMLLGVLARLSPGCAGQSPRPGDAGATPSVNGRGAKAA